MLDVYPGSDDRYQLWSHLTAREGQAQVHTLPWISLPFENALQRKRERQRRQRKEGQHTDLSARMDIPTLYPAGVGSPSAPTPLDTRLKDLVTELTGPVDRAQLDQEIEVNVDDALNLFSLPPVAGVGTATATTTTTQPVTTATQTRPVTSTRTLPVTAMITVPTPSTSRTRPVTSTKTLPTTTAPARRRAGAGDIDHYVDRDDTQYTSQNRCQTTATTSRRAFTPLYSTFS